MTYLSMKIIFFSLILLAVFTFTVKNYNSLSDLSGKIRNYVVATPPCSPKRHIMFLKTHKTGGTTIQVMLLRYADSKNLTMALPNGINFNVPKIFKATYVMKYKVNGTFDFITHHLRFNQKEVKKVVKHEDTFYFAIIRNPVSQMESSFSFFKKEYPAFKAAKSLGDFLNNSNKYYKPHLEANCRVKNPNWSDFGYENYPDFSKRHIEAIMEIEKSFHLILLSEYFDESLILLKEALCWDIDDVMTITQNSRNGKDHETVSEDMASKIKTWNSMDWILYKHFNVTFWAKVEETIGLPKLQDEVAILREKRKLLEKQCFQQNLYTAKQKSVGVYFKKGVHIMFHKVKSELDEQLKENCKKYLMHPNVYSDKLYRKQYSN